jgi:hypothetical protein
MDSGYTDRSRGHHSEANPQFTKQKKERLALDRQQHEGNRIHIHPSIASRNYLSSKRRNPIHYPVDLRSTEPIGSN